MTFAEARVGRITASRDFARILQGADLVEEKVKELRKGAKPSQSNRYMELGKDAESRAFEAFAINRKGFRLVSEEIISHSATPYVSCTPDGINKRKKELLEIKCPQKIARVTKLLAMLNGDLTLDKGMSVQVQAQLWITGYKRCHLAIYHDAIGVHSAVIEPDEKLAKRFAREVMPQAKRISKIAKRENLAIEAA